MTQRAMDLAIFGPACPAAGTALCSLEDLSATESGRSSYGLSFASGRDRFDIVIVRQNDEIRAYVDRCPHAFARLGGEQGDVWDRHPVLTQDPQMICEVHGALFRFEDGLCISGPCKGQSLRRVPVYLDGQTIRIGEIQAEGGAREQDPR